MIHEPTMMITVSPAYAGMILTSVEYCGLKSEVGSTSGLHLDHLNGNISYVLLKQEKPAM